MEPQELREKLTPGVIAFPTTPFHADYSLDLPGLRANLRKLLEHPVRVVIAPGGTGEIFSLTPEEHLEIVKVTLEEVGGKVPVLCGTGFNTGLGVEIAQAAYRAGVQGILAFPPYYPSADPEGLHAYYATLAKATPLGFIIYSRDWVRPTASAVERLAEIPNLVAWKDGAGDMRRLQDIMRRVGDRLAWVGGSGDDLVPAYYSLGIRAYTSSIANVAPKLSLRLHDLASRGHSAELQELMRQYVVPLYEFRGRRRGYEVSVMKEMMDQLGMVGGVCRPPLPDVTEAEKAEIKGMLQAWKSVM